MNEKTAAVIGLLFCLTGVLIQVLDYRESDLLPLYLKNKGLWFLIIAGSFSIFYSFKSKQEKDK